MAQAGPDVGPPLSDHTCQRTRVRVACMCIHAASSELKTEQLCGGGEEKICNRQDVTTSHDEHVSFPTNQGNDLDAPRMLIFQRGGAHA